jgi:hypothetical protein
MRDRGKARNCGRDLTRFPAKACDYSDTALLSMGLAIFRENAPLRSGCGVYRVHYDISGISKSIQGVAINV